MRGAVDLRIHRPSAVSGEFRGLLGDAGELQQSLADGGERGEHRLRLLRLLHQRPVRAGDRVALDGPGVHYLGRQPREVVLGALALCRGLVSMSASESFGIVLCEAWKFRKPVVANRACASFRELVEDGVSGLLAETDAELLAAMRRLLDEPGLAERLGAAGFAAVTRRYSWEMAARAVAGVLTGAAEAGG